MNKTFRRLSPGLVAVFALLLTPQTSRAQFTDNYQTNIISAVVSSWSGVYYVGSNTVFDDLQIVKAGVLTGAYQNVVSYGVSASNNSVLVSDTGSIWKSFNATYVGVFSRGNSLVISNGGQVASFGGQIGFCGSSNSVLVTGTGSVWSNTADLYLGSAVYTGYESRGNSLVIRGGGQVFNQQGLLGTYYGTNSSVLVTGAGSVWNNSGSLTIGTQSAGDSLVISGGGKVLSSSGVIGFATLGVSADSNTVLVSDAGSVWSNQVNLFVGRSDGYKQTPAGRGNSLVISNGGMVVVASNMIVASGNSVVLNHGNLAVGAGLVVTNGAILKGSGTIYANLTLAGTLAPGNSPGGLTNFGSLTLQSSAVLDYKLGGTGQGTDYGFLRVTNGVVILDGMLQVSFANGFETNVLNSDAFTLLTADSTLSGSFTNVLSGERLTTADGDGSFLVSYNDNNLVLSDFQVIPEPSTFVLLILGGGCLRLLRRRLR